MIILKMCIRDRAKGLPVMVVFEGWGASGKGTMISRLIQPLDPRGFKVFTIQAENEEEHMHPFLWRFWTKTPAKGRIDVYKRQIMNWKIADTRSFWCIMSALSAIILFTIQCRYT